MVDITVSEKLVASEFLRGLLEQTVSFWRPADAAVTLVKVMSLLHQPVGDAMPGWLTHLADPEMASFVPADFARAPPENGIVIQASERSGRTDFRATGARARGTRNPHYPAIAADLPQGRLGLSID